MTRTAASRLTTRLRNRHRDTTGTTGQRQARMSPPRPWSRRRGLTIATTISACIVLTVSACSSSSSGANTTGGGNSASGGGPSSAPRTSGGSSSPSTSGRGVDQNARGMLPDAIRTAGAIKFASSFDYPPSDFLSSGGGYEGIEPDILNAAAQVLGVKIDFTHIQGFASLIPAATSGRVDMAGESIAVLPDRLKQVSFVKYGLLTDGLLVPKGNPKHITTDNLCGLSISNESGSEEVGLYDGISKKCVAAGKKPIDNQTYSTEAAQVLAVQTGRADASGFAYPNGAYIASTSKGKFEMAPGPAVDNQKLPVGFVVPKNAAGTQLGQALAAALQVLQSNGTLAKIFTKWNLPTNTIGLGFQSS